MVPGNVKPSVAMLRDVKLLQCFSESELSHLIQVGVTANYEDHANIVIEGELSWGLYLILEGVVGIFKNNKLTGEPYDVGQLRHGNFFGEMSLVDDNPRSATVRALTNCQLFYISKEHFQQYLTASKEMKLKFYETCIQTIVSRLRELDDNYVVSQYQLWKAAIRKDKEAA
ncbi:MAG TPA: hypothetical protein DCS07_15035 [Bdellovibrionales bacterium]|nr:MAG: hypothetical protein A2Z97_10145 [Bdellovibrionales bacterium GWB1_52_6]OFZ05278.1 MAG: hypothetical protein A2X97_10855 [Bdellovibrionales bacterium GWA1_52_35]OFZ42164.1 MAG: hypothetical protein A2070_07535 [Bdellovibrionales bacterium GWC1_52_8]HAR43925.1 hypothetical protein [Bdellovibrionales bacterium]HCM38584.1 hypothetical protein [Bdellovibrionales bacterium]